MKKHWLLAADFVWIAAWIILAAYFAPGIGVLAAAAGAMAGMWFSGRLDAAAIRRSSFALVSVAGVLVLGFLAWMLGESSLWYSIFGEAFGYDLLVLLFWGGAPMLLSFVGGLLRKTLPEVFVAQLIFAGGVLGAILAAHRNGEHHRPYFLADRLLSHGKDPIPALLLAGLAIGIALLAWMFLTGRKRRWRDALIAAALLALVVALLPDRTPGTLLRLAQRMGGDGGGKKGQMKDRSKKKPSGGHGNSQDHDPNPDSEESQGQPQPVAVVTLHDDYDPPDGIFYFRQTILSTFNHNRLTPAAEEPGVMDYFPASPVKLKTVVYRAGARNLGTTITLLVPHSRPFGLIDPSQYGPAVNPDPQRFERAYNVDSTVPTKGLADLLTSDAATPPGDAAQYLAAPDDPRYAELALDAISRLNPKYKDHDVAKAVAIKLWLEENTTYNRSARHDGVADPVSDFLFGDRNGYCVHLSQSAALLFRAAGIPSRISEGYAVEARQRGQGSSLMIRDSDAHAWAEIFVANLGWRVVEITPKKHVSPLPPPPDLDQQKMLAQLANREGPPPPDQPGIEMSEIRRRMGPVLLGLLLAGLIALYVAKVWRWAAVYVCRRTSLPRVAYRAALDRLSEVSLRRGKAETREQFNAAVRVSVPSLEPLSKLHLQAAYRGTAPNLPRKSYTQMLRNVSTDLGRRTPDWRLLLAWLDPVSWKLVR